MKLKNTKVAILVPSASYGSYWPPILHRLKDEFQELLFFTGCVWPKFDPNVPGASVIKIVGKTKLLKGKTNNFGYGRVFIMASPRIIPQLFKFQPEVVFVSGFSIWTAFAILTKPLGAWKIILLYEGSSPNVDFVDSPFRLFFRRLMVMFADGYISNSYSGAQYLNQVLGVNQGRIHSRPYMVPDQTALMRSDVELDSEAIEHTRPVFLFVGQVVTRKGIQFLLEACSKLKALGHENFTLLIVGDGPQKEELKQKAKALGLDARVVWLGWVAYETLGKYFGVADVFVFPSLEDTWGMVILEAMVLGKPVICSKWAGAKELVKDGENGYVIDPYDTPQLASAMANFFLNPKLANRMGTRSKEIIAHHTPDKASTFLAQIAVKVLD
jgi:glycosyltransferase involved in cell wall biosynthesis